MTVLFARSRHVYDSYQDFWRLVELSGYDTCYVDEIDPNSDNCYIFTPLNGEVSGWPGATARIIHYQLEWETHPNDQRANPPGVAEKWTMCQWHADQIGARYVPIGGHKGLRLGYAGINKQHTSERYYDVALMAYMGPPRRQKIKLDLDRKGLLIAPNGWNDARDLTLNSSRTFVHIHQHDNIPGVAALRMALAAAYSLPVISEAVANVGIFGHSHVLWSDYDHLADFAQMWLREQKAPRLADYGHALHRLLCHEQTFRKCIEAAL